MTIIHVGANVLFPLTFEVFPCNCIISVFLLHLKSPQLGGSVSGRQGGAPSVCVWSGGGRTGVSDRALLSAKLQSRRTHD